MREKLPDVLPHGVIFLIFAGVIAVYLSSAEQSRPPDYSGIFCSTWNICRAGLRFKIVPRGTFPAALCSTWNNCLQLILVVTPVSPLFPHFAFSY